jgi:hypothetical protein
MYKNVTVIKEKLGKRYLQAGVAATMALPVLASAAEGDVLPDSTTLKGMLDGLGIGALIGAIVLFMLGIAIGIWGGRKIVGFFSGK